MRKLEIQSLRSRFLYVVLWHVCELLQLTTATTPFSYSFLPSSSFHQCCLKESENASRRPEQILRQNYFLPHVICTEQYNVLWPLPYISITWFPDSLFFLSYMEWKRNESVYIAACRPFLIVLGDFFFSKFWDIEQLFEDRANLEQLLPARATF